MLTQRKPFASFNIFIQDKTDTEKSPPSQAKHKQQPATGDVCFIQRHLTARSLPLTLFFRRPEHGGAGNNDGSSGAGLPGQTEHTPPRSTSSTHPPSPFKLTNEAPPPPPSGGGAAATNREERERLGSRERDQDEERETEWRERAMEMSDAAAHGGGSGGGAFVLTIDDGVVADDDTGRRSHTGGGNHDGGDVPFNTR
ncbi:hypothetical protein HanPI659440_Chr17g0699341 [Helianthus annuus]|nr:hypothetical protein HanPI659440_Chr17g0699341 [Helianthus annuus]